MKKHILLAIALLPVLLFAQSERLQLERDLDQYIVATNSQNCQALMYFAPKMVFVGQTEGEFLFHCEQNHLNKVDFIKKTLMPRYSIDTLVISDGSKYAKVRIPAAVEIEFVDADENMEYHSDPFYYRLIEAYSGQLLDRSDISDIFLDHENHVVHYNCHTYVLGIWEDGHWRFLLQDKNEELPPLDVMDPSILYN